MRHLRSIAFTNLHKRDTLVMVHSYIFVKRKVLVISHSRIIAKRNTLMTLHSEILATCNTLCILHREFFVKHIQFSDPAFRNEQKTQHCTVAISHAETIGKHDASEILHSGIFKNCDTLRHNDSLLNARVQRSRVHELA